MRKPFNTAINDPKCNELIESRPSLVPDIVTSRHTGSMASVLCTNCGDVITFQKSCSDKFCGICNERRRKRLMDVYNKEIEKMRHPKFLTLTLKSQPLGQELLKRLRKSFNRMTHRKKWLAIGGFYVIELGTKKDTGLWNIHIHAVIDSEFMQQDWISQTWLESTGDSMIVDIRKVRSYRYATWYLTKYVAKLVTEEGELTQQDKNLVNRVLKGARLIQRFGNAISPKSTRVSVCRKCGAIKSYISIELELDPTIRSFDKGVSIFKKISHTIADAIESFDWWTFQKDEIVD
jgi:hypothetical protein